MTLPPDSSLLEINDGSIKQCACSLQEVGCIAVCLEANDVISCQSAVYGLSYGARQKLPAPDIRPWDMYKLLHNNAWMVLANHRGSQVKMIIMQHDNRTCILTM